MHASWGGEFMYSRFKQASIKHVMPSVKYTIIMLIHNAAGA